jgi:hypothetical protein
LHRLLEQALVRAVDGTVEAEIAARRLGVGQDAAAAEALELAAARRLDAGADRGRGLARLGCGELAELELGQEDRLRRAGDRGVESHRSQVPLKGSPQAPILTRLNTLPTDQPAEAARVVTPERKPRLSVVATPVLGRGGREHKYLQHLVKRLAEDRGYRAVIEQPILAGAGSVDVSLEKGERRIACEISVTTETEHEIDNIQKCLAGGYETVVAISSDLKVVRRLKERAAAVLAPETSVRVRFPQPEDLVLDELAAGEASGESTVRGYRVKRRYQPVSPEEAEMTKQAVAQVLGGRNKSRRQ